MYPYISIENQPERFNQVEEHRDRVQQQPWQEHEPFVLKQTTTFFSTERTNKWIPAK
jgi:hypothetical protein